MSKPLVFTPFDDESPEEGRELDLEVRNPDYEHELEAERAVLERNPFAAPTAFESFPASLRDAPEDLLGADELCIPQPRLTIVVGYPFDGQWAVDIDASSPAGFTRADLYRSIVRVYDAMYDGARVEEMANLDNKRVESAQFGTAFHAIDDLAIEGVTLREIDGRTIAWISIGS
jgi:hypothetical protein